MAKMKTVKPTIHNYSIVDKATGNRENIKDVVLTYYHSGVIDLLVISGEVLTYEANAITIERYK